MIKRIEIRIIVKYVFFFLACVQLSFSQEKELELKKYPIWHKQVVTEDWLLGSTSAQTKVYRHHNQERLVISNGIIAKEFSISPEGATIGLHNLKKGTNELRAIRPEAQITVSGKTYDIGGLKGQPIHNYLTDDFIKQMYRSEKTYTLNKVKIRESQPRFSWKKNKQWLAENLPWPAPGKQIQFTYSSPVDAPKLMKNIEVSVFYEMYDHAPIMAKWIEIKNNNKVDVHLDRFTSEILALVETAPKLAEGEPREYRILGSGKSPEKWEQMEAPRDYIDRFTQLFIVTDYAMGGDMEAMKDNPAVHWKFDHPEYEKTGIRYYGQYKPARVETKPPYGPSINIKPNDTFKSFITFEMLHDASDQERRGLAERKFWRMMAPWSQENPLFMHVRNSKPESVKLAIDQASEVGFDMVIMTFGSGFDIENETSSYMREMKSLNQYAKNKGITLGGYSLLASRGGENHNLIVSNKTGKIATNYEDGATFGKTPCLSSDWGDNYFRKLYRFFDQTGMGVLEHDGSYPGDMCASTLHSGHVGFEDSQWNQWDRVRSFYQWARSKGIYLNVPDWYFLNGSSKTAMGYVETNWSLPRDYQEIIERQNIYDGTWQKTPSMGWMFVPLTEYHGGGKTATIEPLNQHIDHYERRMMNLLGAGVQAIYRGPRLFDTKETKDMVKEKVAFYKKYKRALDADIIHLRRPDGRDWDGILHVDPEGDINGFGLLYNPLSEEIIREIELPVYYTGATDKVSLSFEEKESQEYTVSRGFHITVKIKIPANGYTWFILKNV